MTMLNDPAIWDMFRAEVDTHMASLNDGLLALERDPLQSSRFEPLMRAAHSIKGAAKIMGVSAAVEIAHVIEDCFVAAREGRLTMTSALVDVLFAGVDLLGTVAQPEAADLDEPTVARVREVVEGIAATTQGRPVSAKPAIELSNDLPSQLDGRSPPGMRLGRALDATWIEAHKSQIVALLRSGLADLHLDFSAVEGIDPFGLAFLSLLGNQARECGTPTAIVIHLNHVSGRWTQFLHATGVNRACQISAPGD